MQLRALMIVNPEVAFFTRVDMTIDYNQMFDSDIIIDLEILIDVVADLPMAINWANNRMKSIVADNRFKKSDAIIIVINSVFH